MSNPPTYSIVIIPPQSVRNQLIRLRRMSLLMDGMYPPHITVKSPFFLRQTGARVLDQIQLISRNHSPFPLVLSGLASFDESVIYVPVANNPSLKKLHEELVEGLAGYVETISEDFDGPNYSPHLTLAHRLTQSEFARIWPRLITQNFHWEFLVDKLYVLGSMPKSKLQWKIELNGSSCFSSEPL
ncbi:MAG TPA: 2'-5' RNA ligase family protein [Firmicutes bacterium]|nr:2'-5' RNA ligase family protein [Bacillota bacterium]